MLWPITDKNDRIHNVSTGQCSIGWPHFDFLPPKKRTLSPVWRYWNDSQSSLKDVNSSLQLRYSVSKAARYWKCMQYAVWLFHIAMSILLRCTHHFLMKYIFSCRIITIRPNVFLSNEVRVNEVSGTAILTFELSIAVTLFVYPHISHCPWLRFIWLAQLVIGTHLSTSGETRTNEQDVIRVAYST